MNYRGALLLAGAFSVFATSAFAAERPWTEARSSHFRVFTNGSNEDARKVLREFEQLRWVFATRFPGTRLDSGAPLTVFATRDASTAKTLDPGTWSNMGERLAGVFHHGWERQYVMVRLDTFGGNGSREVVYHEYTHSILHMNSHWLPMWLDEGIAEFYGYTRFDENRVYVGAPTERYRALNNWTPEPIEDIMAVNEGSRFNGEFFYAESWALVHFLIYGPNMEGGRRFSQFFTLLQQGKDQRKAFQQAFGNPKDVDKDFAAYSFAGQATAGRGTVGQPFTVTVLRNPPEINENEFAFRTTKVAETETELGGFHLWVHDYAGAKPLLEQALKDDPRLGLAHENMAFLDFEDGKDAEAASEFSQAYALDSRLYLSLFFKTMLSPLPSSHSVSDLNTLGSTLGRVLQLNPQFGPAYVELARLAVLENDLDSAILLSRKAEELEPSLAGYHLLTGQILSRMGKGIDAATSAQFVADRWHGPDHNEAVELWNSVPAGQRPFGDAISEIASKDSQVVEGKVKSVTCKEKDQGWAFVLDQSGSLLTFHRKGDFASGFSDTLWYGADHFSLCHHLEGVRAIVHYRAPSDSTYAGDISEIEIRDDLPKPLKESTAASHP